jgi:lipopolysaccharide biosynthesis glycosyltransferase
MRRHASADFPDGVRIEETSFMKDGWLISGINAGVMIMRPSKIHFDDMMRQLTEDRHVPSSEKSGQPEQDFLTRYYSKEWHHLSVRYNYQPHQIAFTDRRGLERCERLTLDYSDVHVVHFSANVKPRDLLINPKYQGMDEIEYAEKILFKQYMNGIHKDTRSRGYSRLSRDSRSLNSNCNAIEAQLRASTRASTGEWFLYWRALIERYPELIVLLQNARQHGSDRNHHQDFRDQQSDAKDHRRDLAPQRSHDSQTMTVKAMADHDSQSQTDPADTIRSQGEAADSRVEPVKSEWVHFTPKAAASQRQLKTIAPRLKPDFTRVPWRTPEYMQPKIGVSRPKTDHKDRSRSPLCGQPAFRIRGFSACQ